MSKWKLIIKALASSISSLSNVKTRSNKPEDDDDNEKLSISSDFDSHVVVEVKLSTTMDHGGDLKKSPAFIETAESRTGRRDPHHEPGFTLSDYDFWNDKEEGHNNNDGLEHKQRCQTGEESSWKILNGHLMKQRYKEGNHSNEIALEMGEDNNVYHDIKRDPSTFLSRDSRRVSFETGGQTEYLSPVMSNVSPRSSYIGKSGMLSRMKSTKSRLIDRPPEDVQMISDIIAKSGQLKSGLLSKTSDIEEEDDPFEDEDLPEEFRRFRFSALTLLQWLSLICIVAALFCSLTIRSLNRIDLWQLKLWKWLVVLLVLICGRLVSGWGIRLIVILIEKNFFLRKRMLYFVYGVRKPVQNCLWLAQVLVTWHILFDKKVEMKNKSLQYVTKVLTCFLIGTLLWLIKTFIVKVMASSFHVSTYFDRIQDSLFNQYVVKILSGPPIVDIQRREEEEERTAAEISRLQSAGAKLPSDLHGHAFPPKRTSGKLKKTFTMLKTQTFSTMLSSKKEEDTGIALENLHKLNNKNVSAWNMKRLVKMVRHGTLTTLDEQVLEDDSVKQIRSELEATAAAKSIFLNVARRGSKFIYLEDLMRFMREDEALRTMATFEGAYEQKRISKSSLKNWMLNAYRERKALALTLNDTKTAVNKLHRMVNFIAGTVIVIIWLIVMEIATSKLITLFSSQLVLAAFIFGNTCKTIFESIIFLFIIHPFDVGDRCEIDGVQLVVEEMNILTTVFLRYDNLKMVFPNSVLSTKPIGNFYRSPDMGDEIEFLLHVATPAEKIALVKQRIMSYIMNKKEHWCSDPMIAIKDFEELNRMRLVLWVTHKMNYQDIAERWERRSRLVEEMVNIFKELDMQYRLLPIDINVCSLPTSTRFPSTWNTAENSVADERGSS